MSTNFQFVPETHSYLQDGREIRSVTQILNDVGLVDYSHIPESVLDHKAEIGTAAHAAAHYFDEGDLDWNTVDSEVIPYLSAWTKFREEAEFSPRLIEQRGIATLRGMRYGYTLDREGTLNGKDTLLEIKCTAGVEISWGPQMAAYELALRAQDGRARQRVAVHLQKDGRYVLIPFNEVADYKVFEWALGIESWKRTKGKVNRYGYGTRIPR
jgi:hypothetical protein